MRSFSWSIIAALLLSTSAVAEDAPAEDAPAESSTEAAPAPAPESSGDGGCSLAVLNLAPQGLPEDQAHVPQILTDSVATELSSITDCRVVTQADIASMLDFEAQKQAMACDTGSASCLAEIGGALGVERVVAGSVGKIGGSFTVQMKLIDIQNAQVLERVDLTVAGDADLKRAARNGARQLYGRAPEKGVPVAAVDEASSGGSPVLFWTGAALVGVGLFAAAGGGGLAALAELQLGEVGTEGKDGVRILGLAGLGMVAGGGLAAVVGLVLLPFGMGE